MEPKSSIPTLSKKVTTNNIEGSEKVNTASHIENGEYDIGFEIVTTIGTDMDAYGSEYKYEVVDILDKGFEYDRESVKIYVGENKIECGKESYTLSDILITEENYNTYKEYFEEGEPSEQYGKKVVLIDFKDIPGKVVAIDTPKNLESKVNKENCIFVTVEDPNEKIEQTIKNIKQIEKINLIKDNQDGTKQYSITSKENIDIRKEIFETFAKNQITIFELKKSEATLEEAFMKLIQKEEKEEKQ